jgi:glycerophosphoryl diester phosphodiesterase
MVLNKLSIKDKLFNKTNYIQNRILVITILFTLNFILCILSISINHTLSVYSENKYIVLSTLISAHRAGAAIAPENTLKAFTQCIDSSDYKVDILEFDLHLTKDNQLVLIHDDTLDRTSNAREFFDDRFIKVKDKTYAELRQLNMGEYYKDSEGNTPYKGLRGDDIPDDLRIMSLIDILNYLENKGEYKFIIEIKNGYSAGKTATDILYGILKERNLLSNTIVGSFNGEILRYIDQNYPDIVRSASASEAISFYLNYLINYNLSKIKMPFKVLQLPDKDKGIVFTRKNFIDYAHNYGIAVQFWINDENKKDNDYVTNLISEK